MKEYYSILRKLVQLKYRIKTQNNLPVYTVHFEPSLFSFLLLSLFSIPRMLAEDVIIVYIYQAVMTK